MKTVDYVFQPDTYTVNREYMIEYARTNVFGLLESNTVKGALLTYATADVVDAKLNWQYVTYNDRLFLIPRVAQPAGKLFIGFVIFYE